MDHIRGTRSAAVPHPGFPCVDLDPGPGQQVFSQQIVCPTGCLVANPREQRRLNKRTLCLPVSIVRSQRTENRGCQD